MTIVIFKAKSQYLLKLCLLLAVMLPFVFTPLLANASISLNLSLDRNEATPADSIRLIVSLSGTRSSDAEPIVKGLDSFRIARGGTSSRVQIVNGQVDAGIDYTYFIQPEKTGVFQIGPAEIVVEGATFRSNTATLTVSKQPQTSGADRGPLSLSASVSSNEAYLEEQILYTLKLYLSARVKDISLNLPEVEGISFKQLGEPLEYESALGDRSYRVVEIRYALLPSKEGMHIIAPSRINLTVLEPRKRSRRSLFDDPFFSDPFFSFATGKPVTVASEALELKVLPLPSEGRPEGFSGLVGTFHIESKVEPSEIEAGESATLTVSLNGRGNVNRIPDLELPELDHAKVYADQPVLEVKADSKGLVGSKTMKWALVPEKEGRYQIPPLTISYFDTSSRTYQVIKTSPHALSVLPGKEEQLRASVQPGTEKGPESPAKEAVKELGRDILPVHTSIQDLTAGFVTARRPWILWVVIVGPMLIYGITFCSIRFGRKSKASMAATKAKKAAKNFMRQCHQGELPSSDLAAAIRDYMNDRLGLSLGSLTPGEAVERLRSRGVSLETAEKLGGVLQKLETNIYVGKGGAACDIGEDMSDLVKQIEKELR